MCSYYSNPNFVGHFQNGVNLGGRFQITKPHSNSLSMEMAQRPLDCARSEDDCDRRQRPHRVEDSCSSHKRAREFRLESTLCIRHQQAAIRPLEQRRGIIRKQRKTARPLVWLMCALLLAIPVVMGGVMQQAIRGKLPQRTQFMPKTELLSWLNQLLQSDFTKVEQCANGAPYCQVLDALFPVGVTLPFILPLSP